MSFKHGKKGRNNLKKSNVNSAPLSQFAVLVSNYPPIISSDAVIEMLIGQVFRNKKIQITPTKGTIFPDYEFSLFFPNQMQVDAVLTLNGSYVYNNPIWIIKYPFFLKSYRPFLTSLIYSSCSNGQVDFNNLAQRSTIFGINPSIINFNEPDFVEYIFYLLGTESRDKRIYIESIILNNNQILNLNIMPCIFVFLPMLRKLYANQNPLVEEPHFLQNRLVSIFIDPIGQNKQKEEEDDFFGEKQTTIQIPDEWNLIPYVDLRSQDQSLWNQYQRNNGWNQSQNQNNFLSEPIPIPIPQQKPNDFNQFGQNQPQNDFYGNASFQDQGFDSGFSSTFDNGSGFGLNDTGSSSGYNFSSPFDASGSSSAGAGGVSLTGFTPESSPEVRPKFEKSDISADQLAEMCKNNVIQ